MSPWRIETVSGRYIVLQCRNEEHARERFKSGYPKEVIKSISKVEDE